MRIRLISESEIMTHTISVTAAGTLRDSTLAFGVKVRGMLDIPLDVDDSLEDLPDGGRLLYVVTTNEGRLVIRLDEIGHVRELSAVGDFNTQLTHFLDNGVPKFGPEGSEFFDGEWMLTFRVGRDGIGSSVTLDGLMELLEPLLSQPYTASLAFKPFGSAPELGQQWPDLLSWSESLLVYLEV